MPRITLIRVQRYLHWVNGMDPGMEPGIQVLQSRMYSMLQEEISRLKGFIMPTSDYEYYIALTNGVGLEKLKSVKEVFEREFNFRIKIASIPHEYPLTAQLIASNILSTMAGDIYYKDGREDVNVIALIRVYVGKPYDTISFFEKYAVIIMHYAHILDMIQAYGGIAGYLGRSDIVVVLPEKNYREFIGALPKNFCIGVGIAYYAGEALYLARKALNDSIRSGCGKPFIYASEGSQEICSERR